MRILYKNIKFNVELSAEVLYKLVCPEFTVEIHPIGEIDPDNEYTGNIVVDIEPTSNAKLMKKSPYVMKGTIMYDGGPLVVSFGGLIGTFKLSDDQINGINKDVQNKVYFYLEEVNEL